MKKPDHVQIVQDYIMSSDLDTAHTLALFERLEPIFELMYDLSLTDVVPIRDIGPIDFDDKNWGKSIRNQSKPH